MTKVINFLHNNLSWLLLAGFWYFSLFNFSFKKYDYGDEWPVVLLMAFLTLLWVIFGWRKKYEKAYLEKVLLLIFGLFLALSFVFSQNKTLGLSEVMAFLTGVTIYLTFAYRQNNWLNKFLKVIVFGGMIAAVLGFILYIVWPEPRMIGPFFNTSDSAHVWPNAFALFLVMVWPLTLIVNFKNNFWKNFLQIFGTALIVAALILTFSRGALIAFGGQLLLLIPYFLLSKPNFRNIVKIGLVAVLVGVLFFSTNYFRGLKHDIINVQERVQFTNEEGLTSKQERIDFWLGAIELAKEKPLFGYGPFSFRQAYNGIQKTFLGTSDHPHNIFLKMAAENGLLTAGAFLLFLLIGLATIIARFKNLNKSDRALVYVMGVSIAGALAHNLIDYNFNFSANLLLLFLLLAFMRSLVIKITKSRRPIFALILSLLLASFALYEVTVLLIYKTSDNTYLEKSFFPRNYYLNMADKAVNEKDFETAILAIDKQLSLNPLDSQAHYLAGVTYCSEQNPQRDLLTCKEHFEAALKLNPMNNLDYYRDYMRVLDMLPGKNLNEDLEKVIEDSLKLLEIYFAYVTNNVHFTAYTYNVEAAARLVEELKTHVSAEKYAELTVKKEKMLREAEIIRANKLF